MLKNTISKIENSFIPRIKQTARIIMNYSSKSSNDAFSLAEKLNELRLRFLGGGPQLMAYYCTADGKVHVVLASLLKINDPISLFIPFYNLLEDKKKVLTMRITHFLGFVQKKAVFIEGEKEPHEVYTTPEGLMEGEFINPDFFVE